MTDFQPIIFLGVGCALSVLGFFLRKEAKRVCDLSMRLGQVETDLAKNEARDLGRWETTNKLLEDRREDVKTIFEKLETKEEK